MIAFENLSPDAPQPPMSASDEEALARWRPHVSLKNRLFTLGAGAFSRTWMQRMNRVEIFNVERFQEARKSERGLLTFSNHVSLFDDPLLTACISGSEWTSLRWIAADAQNFFGSWSKSIVFNGAKCVPVVRGAGWDQMGMRFLIERLKMGEWVHMFPEGGRTRDPSARLRLPFKRGMAELIRAAQPLAVAFHHRGMEGVLPIGQRWPSWGQSVQLRFAEAVDTAQEIAQLSSEAITRWAEERLQTLELQSAR